MTVEKTKFSSFALTKVFPVLHKRKLNSVDKTENICKGTNQDHSNPRNLDHNCRN